MSSPLLVDLYQLTMGQAYLDAGLADKRATFSLFFRRLPEGWSYLLAAGLDDVYRYLEDLRFSEEDLADLESTGLFSEEFLRHLGGLRFDGEVRALPEGTAFFPLEPVLELAAPVLTAQLVETVVLNHVHFQSLVTSKAARCVDAAAGRTLVDFSPRRTHGLEAALKVARSAYLAGFDATSNVLAGREYGIPTAGTMAHSFVESFEDEAEAFRAFARSYPDRSIFLVDTYDTEEGIRRAIDVSRELERSGFRLRGIRLDSGDLLELSQLARILLDEAGLDDTVVFASGGLDEHDVARLVREGAPIGGFGIGSKLGVSADAPYLDMAYKLVAFDGRPTLKRSPGKVTLPSSKQVWRLDDHDVIDLADADGPPGGAPLLQRVSLGRPREREALAAARERAAAERARFAAPAAAHEVRIGPDLQALRERLLAAGPQRRL
jgi:nicotinate phosphoribosyltransferase